KLADHITHDQYSQAEGERHAQVTDPGTGQDRTPDPTEHQNKCTDRFGGVLTSVDVHSDLLPGGADRTVTGTRASQSWSISPVVSRSQGAQWRCVLLVSGHSGRWPSATSLM